MKVLLIIGLVLVLIWLSLGQNIGELAETKCRQYSRYSYDHESSALPFVQGDESGVSKCDELVLPLIIGGRNVDRTEFPHMAAIGFGSYSQLIYLCGGTLISDKFIMTAAHCEKDRFRGRAKAVRLGSISLITNDDHTHIVPIEKVIIHPGYKINSKYNDIALMRLTRKIYFNEFIRPACINVNNHIEWSTAIATGFGVTANGQTIGSNNLLKVQLNKISSKICQRTFKRSRFLSHGIAESQLCVGDLGGNKDTCQGDSGGPLQILLAKPHCMYSIIGITSFGKMCGFENTPAVYTNVAHFVSWIEEIVWK